LKTVKTINDLVNHITLFQIEIIDKITSC